MSPSNGPTAPAPAGPKPRSPRSGWRESLPFFLLGGAALVVGVLLIALHSPSSFGHLPVWTYLLAIGSIALVGGTVASLVGEPIPDLPHENELVGADLIVVSRTRWTELHRMEEWVEGRLTTPAETPGARRRAAAAAPPAAAAAPVPPVEPHVPTLDELLADLPLVPAAPATGDQWRETEDSYETPPPAAPAPVRPPTAGPGRTSPAPGIRKAPPRAAKRSPPRPGARAEVAAPPPVPPELEQLLTELETEATKAIEARDDEPALIQPGALTCSGCQRTIGITESWENCEECLATYCDRCRDQLVRVGDRPLCPACRSALSGKPRPHRSP